MATVKNKLIKNFFTKEELNLFQIYCSKRLNVNKDYTIDVQSFSPAWYNDSLMDSLLKDSFSPSFSPSCRRFWFIIIGWSSRIRPRPTHCRASPIS